MPSENITLYAKWTIDKKDSPLYPSIIILVVGGSIYGFYIGNKKKNS